MGRRRQRAKEEVGREEVCTSLRYIRDIHDPRRKRYQEIKNEWCGVPEVFDRQDILEERHRIDVDCRRTDRTHPLFSYSYADSLIGPEAERAIRRHSTISPQLSDIGAQSPSNEHIDRMGGILLTYNFYAKDLGEFRSECIISLNHT